MFTYVKQTVQRALVVEDDPWMQLLITPVIKSAIPGAAVDWIGSAEEALNMVRYQKYSVIVADINLRPNCKTGLDFWFTCREEYPEVPILLTSSIPVDIFSQRMGLYGPHYISKPFNMVQFKEVIKNLVFYDCLTS